MSDRLNAAVAELVAAIRAEIGSEQQQQALTAVGSRDRPIPVGTYFRVTWSTGATGRWHRARRVDQYGQACRCGVKCFKRTVGSESTEIETTTTVPDVDKCCTAVRKQRWAEG